MSASVCLEKVLADLATEDCSNEEECDGMLLSIQSPEWELLNDYEDWAYLIPDEIRGAWVTFPPEIRLALYIVAKNGAERGKWARDRAKDD